MSKAIIFIPGYKFGGIENTFNLLINNYNYERIILLVEEQADVYQLNQDFPNLKIIKLPNFTPSKIVKYVKLLTRVFKDNEVKTVVAYNYIRIPIVFSIAKFFGVNNLIFHARTDKLSLNKAKDNILHLWVKIGTWLSTERLACSQQAGIYFFGNNNFLVQKNAIDTKRFLYNEVLRASIRSELGIKDETFLVGHVGRFCVAKNHKFLIDVFEKIKDKRKDSKLLLIGDGPLLNEVQEYVKAKGLSNDVIFAGKKSDTAPYYQAMDIFLFPSVYEGFGNVALEAQASGLKVCASDVISRETNVTPNIVYLPLNLDTTLWVDEGLQIPERINMMDCFVSSGFDVSVNTQALIKNYHLDN